jgi:MoxR-like ATPase
MQPVTEVNMAATVHVLRQKKLQDDADISIPEKYEGYVPFGFFKDLKTIIESKQFFPVFITGLSGNGKTLMVEQVCANLRRECIRVNISIETDESDLIGGPTLVDGNVVYRDGPVITAMKRGAVLLIDEVDRGSNKLMCLQGILEGKPYFNKKSGEYVYPVAGFNVVATANTKGRGSDEGKYLSQILDDAFLERFNITIEQEYPEARVELKILKPLINDDEYAENLIKWADVIRKTFNEGGVDEIISTRRLVHIAKTYAIFKDRMKAIELCVNRFDAETKASFLDLYSKVDAKVTEAEPVPPTPHAMDEDIPF